VSLKELDLLIEQILKEREYVSGSKLPTQKGPEKGFSNDFETAERGFGVVSNTANLREAIKKLVDYCSGVKDENSKIMNTKNTNEKFKRLIGSEFLHKLLNNAIPKTNALGFVKTQTGFSLEKQFASLLGGKIIPPQKKGKGKSSEAEDIVFEHKGSGQKWSMKFYALESIQQYGFGQAVSTIKAWLQDNSPPTKLKYLVFVKIGDGDNVGFEIFEAQFTHQEINQQIEEHEKKATKDDIPLYDEFYGLIKSAYENSFSKGGGTKVFGNKNRHKSYENLFGELVYQFEDFYGQQSDDANSPSYETYEDDNELPFREFISSHPEFQKAYNNFYKDKVGDIKLFRGEVPEFSGGSAGNVGRIDEKDIVKFEKSKLKPLGRLLMPRDIDKFMESAFMYLENDINELYINLDNFRDSLKDYYLDSNKTTRTNTERKFTSLSDSFNNSFSENNKLYKSTLEENVKKSKK
jgi:hypothetical protein